MKKLIVLVVLVDVAGAAVFFQLSKEEEVHPSSYSYTYDFGNNTEAQAKWQSELIVPL